jgi:hypothetical protein
MFMVFACFARQTFLIALLALGCSVIPCREVLAQTDPLPSWNDGAARKSITDFVSRVTTPGGGDFVPVGKLDKVLDEATAKGWTVVDMKRDWKTVLAFEPQDAGTML